MALLGIVSWSLVVDALRLISICSFVVCSLQFTWYSFFSLIAVLVSLYILDRNAYEEKPKPQSFPGKNPYKGKRRVRDESKIPATVQEKYVQQILDLVLYDAEECKALRDFEVVKMNTHCTFAKKAILWGAQDYDKSLSLEGNVIRSLPMFLKFLTVGPTLHLDGFVFALPGDEFGQDVYKFGQGVRRVLKCISDYDPTGFHCMNKSYVSKVGWSFEFNGVPIFVTTFAPCYPSNHARFAFGAEQAFVLFQPMYSFAIHDIGDDTPHTNWENPVTVRDKIRVAFRENNREYYIRDTIYYPAAHDIVKPLKEGVGDLVEWWKDPEKEGEGGSDCSDSANLEHTPESSEEEEEEEEEGEGEKKEEEVKGEEEEEEEEGKGEEGETVEEKKVK